MPPMQRVFGVVVVLTLVSACGGGGLYSTSPVSTTTPPAANEVIADVTNRFNPTTLTVSKGTSVTFTFKATTHNVNLALKALRKLIEEESFESVALPRLATGVGGLQWDDVAPLIERHLGDLQIPVYLYTTFHPGVKAKE